MKRILSFITVLSVIFCLCACKPAADNSNTGTPTEPQNTAPAPSVPTPTEPMPTIPTNPENMYSVAMPIVKEEYSSEDNTHILTYTYQDINPELHDRDVAKKIIMDFTNRIEQSRTDMNALLKEAERDQKGSSSFIPYTYEIHYNICRIDQKVLSMTGHNLQIGSNSSTSRNLISLNYDTVYGDVLTLGSILYHENTKDDLAELVIESLNAREDITLFEEFPETVRDRFNRDESFDEDFYFSANGLCFYFAPYEIAPRAYGTIIVEIPYNELTDIISEDYFPAERSYTDGNIEIHPFMDADLESYLKFVEVVTDPGASKHLLTTSSAVQDICLYELDPNLTQTVSFDNRQMIFSTNYLYFENAILLEADLDNCQYLLSYNVDNITQYFLIVKDSESNITSLQKWES